jgi:hypothetical protein
MASVPMQTYIAIEMKVANMAYLLLIKKRRIIHVLFPRRYACEGGKLLFVYTIINKA